MTIAIIITICSLLLLAYIFDLTASKTRIPSVILLLSLGWGVKQVSDFFELQIPDLTALLPIFGTIGLILIVLEGSLELELNKSKIPLIKKSLLVAVLPMVVLSILLALAFRYVGHTSFQDSLINAIPLCVISSAIAIPSAKNLLKSDREFITYETSLSDIIGVILFDFFALNETIDFSSFGHFGLQLVIILIISFIATLGLAFLLSKIDHHIKFAPIVVLIILIYVVSKVFHLPALIFILLFGLILGNIDELKKYKWIERAKPDELIKEVHRFKEIITEGTFLIRTIFFLLFGYLINTAEIINIETIPWSFGIVVLIYLLRFAQLKLVNLMMEPLIWMAPRGLITILLFLAIKPGQTIALVNNSLIIQVIILTALLMMLGLMRNKNNSTSPIGTVNGNQTPSIQKDAINV
jgi:cell volume regulation protein A